MARPLPCIIASVAVLGFVTASFAQVVSFNGTTSASSSLNNVAGSSSGSSAPNFSLMSWRSAGLTPYGQTTVTSSVTSTTTTPPPVDPTTTNPFVGATLSAQGNLSGGSTTTVTSNAASSAPTAATRSSYSWRAVAYTPTPEPLVPTNPLTSGFGTSNNSPVSVNLPVNLATAGGSFAAVPEPSSIVLCIGLAAIVGYGYTRKKKDVKPVEAVTEPANE